MHKELYQDKAKRDARAKELIKFGDQCDPLCGHLHFKPRLVVKRRTGPQNVDPAYVKDADHSLNGEYRHYFPQLYAVEWEL